MDDDCSAGRSVGLRVTDARPEEMERNLAKAKVTGMHQHTDQHTLQVLSDVNTWGCRNH